jgi:hypothetical protein
MSQLKELPEDYWARQARQNKLLEKLKRIVKEEVELPCGVQEKLTRAWEKKNK